MLRCPNCQTHDLGKVGSNQYYCWGCFIELTVVNDQISAIFQVEEDGSLSSLDDLFPPHGGTDVRSLSSG